MFCTCSYSMAQGFDWKGRNAIEALADTRAATEGGVDFCGRNLPTSGAQELHIFVIAELATPRLLVSSLATRSFSRCASDLLTVAGISLVIFTRALELVMGCFCHG